ncbi:hypothetical protein ACFV0T_26295 [Streptomyces sp. NPDC059582]|uniref:hypothetical protein n=1 Tax=Streptomyces sp. NPDC059582 TaxID=3346875 RepID=UPI0036B84350
MADIAHHNDRIPTDPHTLIVLACATLTALLPADRAQALAALLAVALPLIPTERR